ncbi:MAG: copper transporter [Candidatus Desulforudis sp.]|nr:copper transporter [Desulforudis sp.]
MIIDIRYHIASLVAVFLALGIGILVGSSILGVDTLASQQEQIAERLENHLNELREENRMVRAEVTALEAEIDLQSQFLKDVLPFLVGGRLDGYQIALVEISTYPVDHDLRGLLKNAGAEVVSTTRIPGDLNVEGHEENLLSLGLPAPASRDELHGLLAGELARAVVEGPSPLVEYLTGEGLISVGGEYGRPLDAAVLLGGGDSTAAPAAVLGFPIIDRLQGYGLRVCGVEERAAPVSFIKEFQAKLACTVDNIDTTPGQFALVLVLAGQDGHYGVKETAQRMLPVLN